MGLKEKRAAREFEKNRFDSLKNQIFEAAKFNFEIEVNWETLQVDEYAHLYDITWPLVYFQPTINAFKEMCSDEFTKESIEKELKKIVIQNYGDVASWDRFAKYKDGVLTLNHSPIFNAESDVHRRTRNIMDVIESEL